MAFRTNAAPYQRAKRSTLQIMIELGIALLLVWIAGVIYTFKAAEKFADVEKIPVSSTSYAASLAQKESDTACICNEICKDLYDLEIVSDNIQDIKDNKTRFIVLSKAKNSRETKKTSIVFSTKDEPGALYKILGMFSIAEINLTKIESRPAKTKLGDYIFFVDLEGDEKNEKIKLTLANIANYCDEFRILGSY